MLHVIGVVVLNRLSSRQGFSRDPEVLAIIVNNHPLTGLP